MNDKYKVNKKKFSKYLRSLEGDNSEANYFAMLHYSVEKGYQRLDSISYNEIDNYWRVPFRHIVRLNTADKVIKRFFEILNQDEN